MKRFFAFLIFFSFSFFSFSSSISSILKIKEVTRFFSFTVWTLEQGAITVADFLDLQEDSLSFSYTDYDSSCDDGKWIDELFLHDNIFTVKTPQNYKEISSLLDSNKEIDEIADAVLENLKKTENDTEKRFLNESENLSYFSFGKEILMFEKTDSGKTISKADEKKAERCYFDTKNRLIKKENWNIKGGTKDAKITDYQEFTYGDGATPVFSTTFLENEKNQFSYDEKGRVVSFKSYELYKKDEKKAGKYILSSKTDWKYSENGKISEKASEEYSYNKLKNKITEKKTKKEVYEYKIKDSSPDYFYYEDGDLKMSTVYSSAVDYVSKMYFDGGFTVESYYENGKHKKDFLYVNGRLRNVKNYEK